MEDDWKLAVLGSAIQGKAPNQVEDLNEIDLDAAPFGTIQLDQTGTVLRYNATESQLSGLPGSLAK